MIKKQLLTKVLTLLLLLGSGVGKAWAQKSWTASDQTAIECVATLTGQTSAEPSNVNVELKGIGSEAKNFAEDGQPAQLYYKFSNDDSSWIKLTRADGLSFVPGDVLTVLVGSDNTSTKTVGFRLNGQSGNAESADVTNTATTLTHTLVAEDISDDGSIIIRRPASGSFCRYYQFRVQTSYYVGGKVLLDNDLVTVKLGDGTGAWSYDSGRQGITNHKRGDNINESGYIEVTPKKKIDFKLSTYSSANACNLVMYDKADPSQLLVNYRQRYDQTDQVFSDPDFGLLQAGHTYVIFGKSFKGGTINTHLDYIFFKDFTATQSTDQLHTIYTGSTVGTGSDAFGTTFSRYFELADKQQYHFTFQIDGGNNESWENWYLYASKSKTHNGDVANWVSANELLWVRADGFGANDIHLYKNNMSTELTCADNSGLHNADFVNDMKGATVDMSVTYADNRLFIYAKTITSSGNMYYLTGVKAANNSGNPIQLFFGVEHSMITGLEAELKTAYKENVAYDTSGNSQGSFDIKSVDEIAYPYYQDGTSKISYLSSGESFKIYATPNTGNMLEGIGLSQDNPRTWTQADESNHDFWVKFGAKRGPKISFSAPDVFGWGNLPDAVLVSAINKTQGNSTITSGTEVNEGDEIEITYKQFSFNDAQTNGDVTIGESRLVLYNWEINGVEDHTNIPASGIVWSDANSTYSFTATHDMDIKAIYGLNYVMRYKNNTNVPTANTSIEGGKFDVHAYDPGDRNEQLAQWSGMKAGTNVTLEATPNSGYMFDHWIGKLKDGTGAVVWEDENWSNSPTFVFNIDPENTFNYAYGYDIYVEPVFRTAVPHLTKNAIVVNGTNPGTVNLAECIAEATSKSISYDISYAKDATSQLTASVSGNILSFNHENSNRDGGAVIVNVKVDGASIGDIVITVPYVGNHTWDFHTMTNKEDHKTSDDFKLEYEVVENGVHKDPMTVYQGQVKSNNAAIIDATNGLLIDNGGKRNMGLSAIGPDGRTTTPQDLSTVTDVWLVTLKNSTLTIPQVKKDWFIRLYLLPHAGGTQGSGAGTEFTVENLKDLNGKVIDPTHTIVTNGVKRPTNGDVVGYVHNQGRIDGCLIFRVQEDGDVKINFSNNGWDKLVRVVVDNTYHTELVLGSDGGGKPVDYKRYNHSWVYREYDSSYGKENSNPYIYYNGDPNILAENAKLVNHTIDQYTEQITGNQVQGTLSNVTAEESEWRSAGGVTYRGVTVRGNDGVGNVKIISNAIYDGKVRNGNWQTVEHYVLNSNETWVAVGKLKVQKYPYTWDFAPYNMDKPTGDNKTTAKISANSTDAPADTLYGSWKNVSHNITVQVPGTPTIAPEGNPAKFQNMESPYYRVDDEGKLHYDVMIWKPLFADGSQLTVGTETIRETEGLGISIGQSPLDGNSKLRKEQISLNGSTLSVNDKTTMTVTIPEVPTTMYVFVKCTNKPSSVANATETDEITCASGVYCYRPTINGDVKITFPASTEVERIGVTDQIKDIKYYGWATESRAIAIDHKETDYFSADTKIYKLSNIDGWNGSRYTVSTAQADEITGDVYIPAGTGILMSTATSWTQAQGLITAPNIKVPLFVPAVNIPAVEAAKLEGNRLVASTTATQASESISSSKVTDPTEYYTLSNYCYKVDKDNGLKSDKIVTAPAFYRYIGSGATMTNKAYIKFTEAAEPSSSKLFSYGVNFDDEDEATAIGGVYAEESIADGAADVYYNVNGQLLNGKPTTRGIYIKNGKKFYVK